MWCLSGRAGEEEEEDAPNVGQSSRGGDWAGAAPISKSANKLEQRRRRRREEAVIIHIGHVQHTHRPTEERQRAHRILCVPIWIRVYIMAHGDRTSSFVSSIG